MAATSQEMESLRQQLRSDRAHSRAGAVDSFSLLTYPSLEPDVIALLLHDPEGEVRAAACLALANHSARSQDARRALCVAAEDKDGTVRRLVPRGLRHFGLTQDSLRAFLTLSADPVPAVRKLASDCLLHAVAITDWMMFRVDGDPVANLTQRGSVKMDPQVAVTLRVTAAIAIGTSRDSLLYLANILDQVVKHNAKVRTKSLPPAPNRALRRSPL